MQIQWTFNSRRNMKHEKVWLMLIDMTNKVELLPRLQGIIQIWKTVKGRKWRNRREIHIGQQLSANRRELWQAIRANQPRIGKREWRILRQLLGSNWFLVQVVQTTLRYRPIRTSKVCWKDMEPSVKRTSFITYQPWSWIKTTANCKSARLPKRMHWANSWVLCEEIKLESWYKVSPQSLGSQTGWWNHTVDSGSNLADTERKWRMASTSR